MTERVRKSEVAQEIGEGLLKGLRALGAQLDRLASDLQTKPPTGATTPPSTEQAQDIPIDKRQS